MHHLSMFCHTNTYYAYTLLLYIGGRACRGNPYQDQNAQAPRLKGQNYDCPSHLLYRTYCLPTCMCTRQSSSCNMLL